MESGQTAFHFKCVQARALVEQAIDSNRGFAGGYIDRLMSCMQAQ